MQSPAGGAVARASAGFITAAARAGGCACVGATADGRFATGAAAADGWASVGAADGGSASVFAAAAGGCACVGAAAAGRFAGVAAASAGAVAGFGSGWACISSTTFAPPALLVGVVGADIGCEVLEDGGGSRDPRAAASWSKSIVFGLLKAISAGDMWRFFGPKAGSIAWSQFTTSGVICPKPGTYGS